MNRDVRAALLSAAATLLTMLSLAPLLADRSWLQPVALVVAAVGLAGTAVAAAGLPRWLAPPLAALAGLVIATALLVPSLAAVGGFVPTPTSVRALGTLLRSGLATTQVVVPPAPTDDAGVVTMLTLAAGAVAVLTLLIAGPLRRPGAAGLPLLLVVCVATALAPDGIGVTGYLSAALGYLGLTLTDADQRVRRWGEVLGRQGRSGEPAPSGVPEALTRAAAVTAVVALLAGALLPLLTPGSGGDRLQSMVVDRFGGGAGGGGTTVNPFLDLREDLTSQDDTVVLRYATDDPDPDPLRIVTSDAFDGAIWRPTPPDPPAGQDLTGGLPPPPGADAEVLAAAEQVSTAVSVGPLAESYLPLPYPASTVAVEGAWGVDARTLNVLSGQDTTEGLSYSVTHYDIRPDADQLDAVPADGLDPVWTELPEDMADLVRGEAERVVEVAGATTRYEQALALQQWFRSSGGFTYSLDAPDVTDRDAVEAFLQDRRGYCVQFASTMALMARSLDVPARVAVGFLPGAETSPGQWEIRADDAHAWPELYFEGVGWVRFEPTPATRTQAPPDWAVPRSEPADPGAPAPSQAPQLPEQDQQPGAAPPPGTTTPEAGPLQDVLAVAGQVLLVLGALLVVAAVLALPRAWRWWRSRARWRRAAGDDAARAAAAWLELLERLADLQALPRGATVRDQAADLEERERLGAPAREALERLRLATERALYAAGPTASDSLEQDVRTVLDDVAASRDRRQRLAATWFAAPSPDVQVRREDRVAQRVG
ncbi:transglutaminaseTgpA domain-containing protein [Jannaschia sp. R86511]|uniref:transglutaminaseTgpA domain-containing protein n=1 Tax=Jannaschia sp. R86511 TaxID=3093853 RepID=UPI0036D2C9E7